MDACLDAYPEQSGELEPLLTAALQLRSRLAPSSPDPSFASNAKIRILNQIQAKQVKRTAHARPARGRVVLKPVFAILGLVMIFAMLGSGFGIIHASAEALPGDPLYGVKRALEETRLVLARSAADDADLLMQFTNRRLEEMNIAFSAGLESAAEIALMEYEGMLLRLLDLAYHQSPQDGQDTIERVHNEIAYHEKVLREALEKAPATAQAGIENALEKSSHGKAILEQLQRGGPPSDLAPGQEGKESKPSGGPPEDPGQGKPDHITPGPPQEDDETDSKPSELSPGPPEEIGGPDSKPKDIPVGPPENPGPPPRN